MSAGGRDDHVDERTVKIAAESVLRVSRLVMAISLRSFAESEHSVTERQFRIMVDLFGREVRLSDLAVGEGVAPSTMTRLVDRLHDAGLVGRSQGDSRREVVVSLTARGRSVVIDILDLRRAMFRDLIARMHPEEVEALSTGMSALARVGDERELRW